MTVTYVKSTHITNKEGSDHGQKHTIGHLKSMSTVCEASAAIADNGVLSFFEIPVDANITSVRIAADDLGNTATMNLGFYPGTIDPATVADTDAVDEDAIVTLLDVHTGANALTEVRYETLDIDTTGKKAWELAGLSARPAYGTFMICGTIATGASTAAGTVALIVDYI